MTQGTRIGVDRLVTTDADLDRAVERSLAEGCIGLDTEFMREKTYRAELCLVQIAAGDSLFLIDPLAQVDMGKVGDLIQRPEIQVVVHAGRQDFELFHEHFGVLPHNIFDVQLAAGFAGYGANLPYGRLVSAATGTTLEKGESYTDWCRRPLTEAQMSYAADDVRYLIAIADRLLGELDGQGRGEWVREEMLLLEDPGLYSVDHAEVWRKVGGRGHLSSRQTSVLRELAKWREETASRRNIPRGWVVKDPTLIELARRAPTSLGALKSVRGLNAREIDKSGQEILGVIATGKQAPPLDLPQGPSRQAQARARVLSGLADAVVRSRCDHAQIATELVATRGELESVLAEVISGDSDDSKHRLLTGWRRELAGNAVVALAQGKIAVRAIANPPYVEEVPL